MPSIAFLCRRCVDRLIAGATLAGFVFCALSAPLRGQTRLTVLNGFDQPPDTSTVVWMEQEAGELFADAGLSFSWLPRQHNSVGVIGPLVSVQFHGKCVLDSRALSVPTPGPMAWIQSQDGEIRPFIDVDCDRTAAMVWQNRGTLPLPLLTRAFGRALGRVMAHELYHYLTQSAVHTASELFSQAMNSRDLTLPQMRFETSEIEALRKGMSKLAGNAQGVAHNCATE